MVSGFGTVDEYIAALPADVQPIMEGIRRTIRGMVPGVDEKISYAMPTLSLIHI